MKISTVNAMVALGAIVCLVVLLGRAIPARSAPPAPNTSSLGMISGRVTLDDGKPAVGYSIVARSARYFTPAPAGEAVTDADGHYQITLDTTLSPTMFQSLRSAPSDTQFTVTVQGQEPLYLVPSKQVVTLPPNLTLRNVNFRLTKGPQITIRVHDALTGQPVPGVTAKYLGDRVYSNDYKTVGVTDAQGQIVFRVPTLDVQLTLVPPGGNTPTVKAAPGYNLYREVSLPTAKDVVWDMPTYPTTPPMTPSVWRGVVLAQDGRPAAYAKVSILRGGTEAATVTGKQGRFTVSLPPLTPEQYNDRFQGVGVLAEKGDQTAVLAAPVDATWAGMTVRLARKPLASYAGTVVGPDGRPESGVSVSCRGGLEVAPDSGAGVNRSGVTDAWGRFHLADLPAGRYQFYLGGGLFGPQTVPPSDPSISYSSALLTLRDGEQHNFGRIIVFPADEVLAGQLLDHDGKPATADLTVIVHGAHTYKTVEIDKAGRFRVYHIVREALTLDLFRPHQAGFPQSIVSNLDLFLKVPVQAGQQDVRVVMPAGALPPPAIPSALPVPIVSTEPVGPPQVTASSGVQPIAGLSLLYYQENAPHDLHQTLFHAILGSQPWFLEKPGKAWQGSMMDMDGMRLTVKSNRGILKDRTGHMLWTGFIQPPQELTSYYTAVTDTAKPNYLTLQDPQGRTLWSGLTASKTPAVVFVDGYIAVVGPKGRIVWQQVASVNGIGYRTFNHGQEPGHHQIPVWIGSSAPFDGVIHFAVTTHRAVFQTSDGHAIYSGNLLTLTLTVTGTRKSADAANDLSPMRRVILPFAVSNSGEAVTCTLYDAQGRAIPTSLWKQGT